MQGKKPPAHTTAFLKELKKRTKGKVSERQNSDIRKATALIDDVINRCYSTKQRIIKPNYSVQFITRLMQIRTALQQMSGEQSQNAINLDDFFE